MLPVKITFKVCIDVADAPLNLLGKEIRQAVLSEQLYEIGPR